MGIVYRCKNLHTNKSYIGITIRTLNIRKQEHLKELRNNIKGGSWQEDYNIHGVDSFIFEVLEICEDNLLSNIENRYILSLNTLEPKGYNKIITNIDYSNIDKTKNLKYDIDVLINIVKDLLSTNPILSIFDIHKKYGISEDTIQDISRIKTFKWLEDYIPEEYNILRSMHDTGIFRVSYLNKEKFKLAMYSIIDNLTLTDKELSSYIGISIDQLRDIRRGKSNLWLKDEDPVAYTTMINNYRLKQLSRLKDKYIYDNTTKNIIQANSIADMSKLLDIDHRRVSDLFLNKVTSIGNNRYIVYNPK